MSHPNPQAEYGENEIGTPMTLQSILDDAKDVTANEIILRKE
jgi:hypothetical protein